MLALRPSETLSEEGEVRLSLFAFSKIFLCGKNETTPSELTDVGVDHPGRPRRDQTRRATVARTSTTSKHRPGSRSHGAATGSRSHGMGSDPQPARCRLPQPASQILHSHTKREKRERGKEIHRLEEILMSENAIFHPCLDPESNKL